MPGKGQAKTLPDIHGKYRNGMDAQVTACDCTGNCENSQ